MKRTSKPRPTFSCSISRTLAWDWAVVCLKESFLFSIRVLLCSTNLQRRGELRNSADRDQQLRSQSFQTQTYTDGGQDAKRGEILETIVIRDFESDKETVKAFQ